MKLGRLGLGLAADFGAGFATGFASFVADTGLETVAVPFESVVRFICFLPRFFCVRDFARGRVTAFDFLADLDVGVAAGAISGFAVLLAPVSSTVFVFSDTASAGASAAILFARNSFAFTSTTGTASFASTGDAGFFTSSDAVAVFTFEGRVGAALFTDVAGVGAGRDSKKMLAPTTTIPHTAAGTIKDFLDGRALTWLPEISPFARRFCMGRRRS